MDPNNTTATATQGAPEQGGAARGQDQGEDRRGTRLERAAAFLEQARAKGGKPDEQEPDEGHAEEEGDETEVSDEGEEKPDEQETDEEKPDDKAEKKRKPSQYERTRAQRDRLRQENESLETDYRKVFGIASNLKSQLDDAKAEIAHLRGLMQQHGVDEDPQSRAVREAQQRQREAERKAQQLEQDRQNAETRAIRQQLDEMADSIVAEAQALAGKMRVDAVELVDEFDLLVRRWEKRGKQGPEPKLSDVAKRLARMGNVAAVERRQNPSTRAPLTTPRGGRGASARISPVPLKTKSGDVNSDAIAKDIERRRGMRAG